MEDKKKYKVIIGILAVICVILGSIAIFLESEDGKEWMEKVQSNRMLKSFVGKWVSDDGAYNEIYLNDNYEVVLCDSDLKRIGYGTWFIDQQAQIIRFSIQNINRYELIEPIIEERGYEFLDKEELVLTPQNSMVQLFSKESKVSTSLEDILHNLELRFDKAFIVQQQEYLIDTNVSTNDEMFIETEQWMMPNYTYQNYNVSSKQAIEILKRVLDSPDRIYVYEGIEVVSNTIYHSIFSMTESSHGPLRSCIDVQTGLVYDWDDVEGELYGIYKYQDNIAAEVLHEMPMSASEQSTIEATNLRKIIASYKEIFNSIEYPYYYVSNVTMPFEIMCIDDRKYTVYQIEITSIEDTKLSEWLFLEDTEEKLYIYKEGINNPISLSEVKKATSLMETWVYGNEFEHQILDIIEHDEKNLIKISSIGRDENGYSYTGIYYVDTTNENFYLPEEIENGEHK